MKQLLEDNRLILMEGAIVERLRRNSDCQLHPRLVNAPLIYDQKGKKALAAIYQEYIDIASDAAVPMLLCAPTWRASHDRVIDADVPASINIDAVQFLQRLRNQQAGGNEIKIGGLMGCKNDCYQPEEGLSIEEAQSFHQWQVDQLVQGGVDYLIAETLPNVEEALGIAKAMESSGVPYIISFVISRDGKILDGSSLSDAVNYIDSNTDMKPLGYMVNCAYPAFLCADSQPVELFDRLIGYQANASSLDHCDLDGADELQVDSVSEWGKLMLELNKDYGVKILGGCCGTSGEHLRFIAGS